MYKCESCGHLFEEGEQAVWEERHNLEHGPYEQCEGCPLCYSGFEETKACKHCGSNFLEDELYEGICKECLQKSIKYDTFLEYLTESNMLAHFIFEKVWESAEPIKISEKLMGALREIYLRMKANDLICNVNNFISLCREYVMDDDGEYGREHYAEWLNKREGK